MTVREMLDIVDFTKKNEVSDELKIRWINDVDSRVQCEVHRIAPEKAKRVVSENDVLTVPDPYASLYMLFVVSMIEFSEGDYTNYARLTAEFEKSLVMYAKSVIRGA